MLLPRFLAIPSPESDVAGSCVSSLVLGELSVLSVDSVVAVVGFLSGAMVGAEVCWVVGSVSVCIPKEQPLKTEMMQMQRAIQTVFFIFAS